MKKTKSEKKLFFIAGTKGGIGKTTFAIYLANAAEDCGKKVKVYDSDSENKTLVNLMKNAVYLDDSDEDFPLDPIINDVLDENDDNEIFIVDMKAGTSRTTHEWFNEVPWNELSENGIKVYVVGCVTSDPDSSKTFAGWVGYFADKAVSLVICKNEKDGTDFEYYRNNLSEMIDKVEGKEFTFRGINDQYQSDLNKAGILLRDIVNGKKRLENRCGKMELSRMRTYYHGFVDQLKEALKK